MNARRVRVTGPLAPYARARCAPMTMGIAKRSTMASLSRTPMMLLRPLAKLLVTRLGGVGE
jgi:hypothetical protein